jgi:hydroxyacylglutathione hydrolase
MIIHQIPVRNSLRNFVYLLADAETKEALAIDPLAAQQCLDAAEKLGVKITKVVNTHEHHDHVGGNSKIIEVTGAKLFVPNNAKIPNADQYSKVGESISVGRHVLKVLDTPGHTMTHICLYYECDDKKNESSALFSGDTLFSAGVGNCHNGGDPEVLYNTVANAFFNCSKETRLFTGHDYIVNNLRFTLDREPDNIRAKELLDEFSAGLDAESYITTFALEHQINVFMRLDREHIREKLNAEGHNCHDDKSTFLVLRKLRNQW